MRGYWWEMRQAWLLPTVEWYEVGRDISQITTQIIFYKCGKYYDENRTKHEKLWNYKIQALYLVERWSGRPSWRKLEGWGWRGVHQAEALRQKRAWSMLGTEPWPVQWGAMGAWREGSWEGGQGRHERLSREWLSEHVQLITCSESYCLLSRVWNKRQLQLYNDSAIWEKISFIHSLIHLNTDKILVHMDLHFRWSKQIRCNKQIYSWYTFVDA